MERMPAAAPGQCECRSNKNLVALRDPITARPFLATNWWSASHCGQPADGGGENGSDTMGHTGADGLEVTVPLHWEQK